MRTITDEKLKDVSKSGKAGDFKMVPAKAKPVPGKKLSEIPKLVTAIAQATNSIDKSVQVNAIGTEALLEAIKQITPGPPTTIWEFTIERHKNGLIKTISAKRK